MLINNHKTPNRHPDVHSCCLFLMFDVFLSLIPFYDECNIHRNLIYVYNVCSKFRKHCFMKTVNKKNDSYQNFENMGSDKLFGLTLDNKIFGR